jgi:phage terminase large subunit
MKKNNKRNLSLNIALLPKQKLLLKAVLSNEFAWIGYGGARGGAKSHAIRELALFLGMTPKYRFRSLILRRFSGELLKNHIHPLLESHPGLSRLFNKSEYTLYTPDGKPVIQFGYADSEEAVYTFQGTEYDLVFIDEASQCTPKQIMFLRTINRTTKPEFRPKMILTMNPGGAAHSFLKRIFVDNMYEENENAADYFFIQSHVWDNVFWSLPELRKQGYTIDDYYRLFTEEDRKNFCLRFSDYAKNLSRLPDELVQAHLYGDWEIFGGRFFKGFDRKRKVIEPFEIPENWTLIGSIDPGFSSPCSFGITAQDPSGNLYRVATYYESERSADDHAEAIKELFFSKESLLAKYTAGRKPSLVVSGRDAFAKKDRYAVTASERTFADVFADAGIYLHPAQTDRQQGWWAWKSYLPDNYFIFSGFNKPLIDEIMAAESDNKNPEDLAGRGNDPNVSDHALDEQRYAIMAIHKPAKAAKQKPPPRPGSEDLSPQGKEVF